ncbi:MAG: glycosyltransferase family 4 protein [Candidatus ainarchaeum sp.]|nr:glycosyltransferase family 4 protein [Candidatus ainarchaeum sp.]
MKIAYFVWEYPPRLVGGLGTYASEIVKKFDEMGHEVQIFTMNSDHGLETHEKQGKNIRIHRPIVADASNIFQVFVDEELKNWGPGFKFFSDVLTYNVLSANKCVNDIVREWKPDIAVCHDWLSAIGGAITKQGLGCPLVFHVHSTEHGRSGGSGSPTVRSIESTTAQQADIVVTVSYAMREELSYLKFPGQKVRVVWNGVDEDKYNLKKFSESTQASCQREHGISGKGKMILFTGRLTYVKGIDSLVRAMPMILAEAPETTLVVLGTGEMYEDLKNAAQRLGVANNVVFINKWVDEKERLRLYACADLVAAPSRYEPFGIVSLEGMAMGKPVLVGYGGLREAVIEGQHGLYCDPNSPANIAEQALKVLKNDELAARLGENGRRRVEKFFTWDKVAADTIAVYDALVSK